MKTASPRSHKWLVFAGVGVGNLAASVSATAVSVALPVLQRDLGLSLPAAGWVLTSYLLTITSLLLLAGRLGDAWGYRTNYLVGFVLFGAASLGCGFAPSFAWLLGARILQGLGASLLWATGPALLTTTFPGTERGRALGMYAAISYLGLTLGPSIGGFVAGRAGWRMVFFATAPVAALGVVMALLLLPRSERRAVKFDVLGAALLACALTATLTALSRGPQWGWASLPTVAFAGGGLLSLVAFVIWESRAVDPMFPLALFRNLPFATGVAAAFVQYVVVFMLSFLLPFLLEGIRGKSSQETGELMTLQPFVMAIVAPLSGWAADRIGARGLSVGGLLILALGVWLVARVGGTGSDPQLLLALAIVGLGAGMFSANNSLIMGAVSRERQGTAAGTLAVSRNLGMAVGIALSGAMYHAGRTLSLAHGATAADAALRAFQQPLYAAAMLAAAGAALSLVKGPPAKS